MNKVRATIDIGSNSVLLLLAHVHPFRELAKLSAVTGLGKGLDKNGVFAEESMHDTYNALKNYAELCAQEGLAPQDIIATATEASRVALNAPWFYEKVRQEIGINVQIISGRAEAILTTKGILFNSAFTSPEVIVMDIGGASTEIIRVDTQSLMIKDLVSLKVGAVRVTDWLSDGNYFNNFQEAITSQTQLNTFSSTVFHCVAGTMTSLANMHLGNKTFIEDEVHGMSMTFNDLNRLHTLYGSWDPKRYLQEFPFLGKRADTIRGGLILAHDLLAELNVQKMVISTYGLRYGTFIAGEIADEYLAK